MFFFSVHRHTQKIMASKTPPRTEQSTSTSFESIGSIGIGKTTTTAQSPSSPNTKLIQDIPRLRPEDGGALPDYICLYDCIVYYMMCPNHDRIAITRLKRVRNSSNRDRRIIWLPFIVLPDHVTWEQAANDGLTLLFGYKDDEDCQCFYECQFNKRLTRNCCPDGLFFNQIDYEPSINGTDMSDESESETAYCDLIENVDCKTIIQVISL